MKKLIITASVFLSIGISAQLQKPQAPKFEKPTVEQQLKAFDNLGLTTKQKSEIEALYKEREAKFENLKGQMPPKGEMGTKSERDERPAKGQRPEMPANGERPTPPQGMGDRKKGFEQEETEFNTKLKSILTSSQYSKYETSMKNNKPAKKAR